MKGWLNLKCFYLLCEENNFVLAVFVYREPKSILRYNYSKFEIEIRFRFGISISVKA